MEHSKRVAFVFLFTLLTLGSLVCDATSPRRSRHHVHEPEGHDEFQPISNLDDPRVATIAHFALDQHFKHQSRKPTGFEVLKGWKVDTTIGATTSSSADKYKLDVRTLLPRLTRKGRASHGPDYDIDVYQVIVEDKPSTHYRKLMDFRKIHGETGLDKSSYSHM